MGQQIVELNCPGCGARVNTGQKECDWCHKPIVISTFNSVYSMPMPEVNKYVGTYKKALGESPDNVELNKSIAMCYLKLRLYDKALSAFEKAIEENFDDSENYFAAAVCLLKGKRPFLCLRKDADKALEYLNAACMIEPKGIYYCFAAFITNDFYNKKHLKRAPTAGELLDLAGQYGIANGDLDMLSELIGVDISKELNT